MTTPGAGVAEFRPGRAVRRSVVLGAILVLVTGPARANPAPADAADFDPGRASFRLAFRDLVVPYRVFLLQALPGEAIRIRALPGDSASTDSAGDGTGAPGPRPAPRTRTGFTLEAEAGEVRRRGPRSWTWTAPGEPGRHLRLTVRDEATGDSVLLNTFVLVPADRVRDGRLDGYRLGTFPTPAYRGLPQYRRPRGYLRLTAELGSVPVSPHFTLGQFPCKRPRGYPKYLLLGPKMLLKLERMLQDLADAGVSASGFHVMSAYRSPWYNTRLLGRPRYSRHIYGDAADVFVDEDGDGYMDDLNGDGRITIRDAEVLFRIADRIDREEEGNPLTGGLWKYRKTSNHPPFVHVDTRGFVAR